MVSGDEHSLLMQEEACETVHHMYRARVRLRSADTLNFNEEFEALPRIPCESGFLHGFESRQDGKHTHHVTSRS